MEYVLSTAAENDLWNLAESLSRDPHILRVEPFPGPPRPPTANDPGSGLRPIRVVISDSLDQEGLARLIAQWRLARPGLPKADMLTVAERQALVREAYGSFGIGPTLAALNGLGTDSCKKLRNQEE